MTPTGNSPGVSFGPRWKSPADEQNSACLACHQDNTAMLWVGSVHEDEDLGCTGCHDVHTRFDAVRDRLAQADTCFNCHKTVQSAARLQSRHPINEGQTACVDCHDPHGSTTVAELVEPTLNDTCYQCHAEKRGPFVFEHQPATEDCSLCHRPHGSVNPSLLTVRGPFLCQQCHSAAFHPSQLFDGDGLPDRQANQNLLGKNCMNCHSQVHGSNHPSGARMTR
jgi:DmsE family decaheme c-type cytochrome